MRRCGSNIEIGRWEMHVHPASVAPANSADPKYKSGFL